MHQVIEVCTIHLLNHFVFEVEPTTFSTASETMVQSFSWFYIEGVQIGSLFSVRFGTKGAVPKYYLLVIKMMDNMELA